MDTASIVTLSVKLLTWMRVNTPNEREPSVTGRQVGGAIVDLVAEALATKPTEPADLMALAFAAEVLELYATHVHAVVVIPVPTPTEAAKDAADQIRKVLQVAASADVLAEPAVLVAEAAR